MENIETTKVKAQGRVRLLTVIVLLLVLFGGAVEYKRLNTPTDEMVVAYKTTKKIEKVVEYTKKEDLKPVVTVKQNEVEVNLSNAVDNFFGYFEKVKEDLESVVEPISALDNIVQSEPVEVKKEEQKPFEEGKIEIYDENKGVVAVEEVKETVEEDLGEEVSLDEVYEEETPVDEVKVEVNEVPVEEVVAPVVEKVEDVEKVVEKTAEVVSKEAEKTTEVATEKVEETVDIALEKVEELKEDIAKVEENVEADVAKAKSEIENIVVDMVDEASEPAKSDEFEEEVGGSDDVKMKFGENGISIEGPDGVALRINENGLMINGLTVDMPEEDSESEKMLDENAEAIVNKFKNVTNENVQEVENEAINLLKGIDMQNN